MRFSPRAAAVCCLVLALALGGAPAALGHAEREAFFPDGSGVQPEYRTSGPQLVVCKPDSAERIAKLPADLRARNVHLLAQCGYAHIQAAVDAVTQRGSRILVLPGLYQEEPSFAQLSAQCERFAHRQDHPSPGTILSYEEQRACPTAQNMISVFGDSDGDRRCDLPVCDLQIEGTGARPTDVVVDGRFRALNGIRADRADGFYLRNLTVERTEFNAVYILETDGFVIDDVVGRWNDEYAFLTFAVDHGLYTGCEGYGNGDSALYPGSASDINTEIESHDVPRYAVEIRGCRSHHNTLGYSGTAGNSVLLQDNDLYLNSTGVATDSLFPDHPGLPQDHAAFVGNRIYRNNMDYFEFVRDGTCDDETPFSARGYEHGVVCPVIPAPVGSGVLIAGGNWNRIEGNDLFDNWRYGTIQFWVPAPLREEQDPSKLYDTSHNNRYTGNRLGFGPEGLVQPNGEVDFWWDDEGTGNCWQGNVAASGAVRSNATGQLPTCTGGGSVFLPGNPVKQAQLAPCAAYSRRDGSTPAGCAWFDQLEAPGGREPSTASVRTLQGPNRIETALATSWASHPQGAEAVVIARADDYADALVAAPLAAYLDAPILLTGRDGLDAAVAREIRRLGARRAVVMGGSVALRPPVEDDLRAAGVTDLQRIGGRDRFDTSARLARRLGGTVVYLAQGADADPARGWPDALAVSGLAAAQLRPILLTRTDNLPQVIADAMTALRVDGVSIVGGRAAVSEAVEQAVQQQVGRVERLAGADRYATSAAVAERALLNVDDPHSVWFATGRNWPDALVAGPAIARDGGMLLLVDGREPAMEGASGGFFADALPVDRVTLVGGGAVIDPNAVPRGL